MNKKLINIVKGDINTAILNGSYNRNTAYQTNIEFNTPTKLILLDGVPYSNPSLTKVTWLELKDLRDNNRLIAGSLYRITDYNCTTTQENTQSAGHQFDIVLLALSENKLAEEGWAMMHENDTYFANSNLSAWKVWYSLDNDKSRFAWADDSVDEDSPASVTDKDNTILYRNPAKDSTLFYAWTSESNKTLYTASETPNIGDDFLSATGNPSAKYGTVISFTPAQEGTGLPNGRGVIYRLIDEWNIDYPCDFKNMQTLVPMDSDGNIAMQNPVTSKYCYAFTDNTSGEPEDLSIKGHAINIKVKPNLEGEENFTMYFSPRTLFYTRTNDEQICIFSDITIGQDNGTLFIDRSHGINILDGSINVILKKCNNICMGYDSRNIMLDTVAISTFGSNCQNIQLANKQNLNYGNNGVELATKDDLE